jgi:hypothetical protein
MKLEHGFHHQRIGKKLTGVQSALMIVHQVLPGQAKEDGFP